MTWAPFIIDGGLDLITPAQAVKPGRVTDVQNFEVARTRGLSLIAGYEKFDGGASPSAAGQQLVLTIQTSFPPFGMAVGDLCHLTGTGNIPDVPGTVIAFSVGPTGFPVVSVKLNAPLPYTVQMLNNGITGVAFFDDTTGNSYNILGAVGGFAPSGVNPPGNLSLFPFLSTQAPSYLIPGQTYAYRVSAVNANGESYACAEQTVTMPAVVNTTTNGVISQPGGGNVYAIPVVSSAPFVVGEAVYITDGVNTLLNKVTLIPDPNTIRVSADTTAGGIVIGNPTLITSGHNVIITSYVFSTWDASVVPAGVPSPLGYKVYGRTMGGEQFMQQVPGPLSNTIPYFGDFGTITPNGALPAIDTSGSVTSYNTALLAYYNQVSATIQQVPGQGSVNGVFWLKDQLYATRDYLAANFSAGSNEPANGDTLFQGASFGAATWIGQVAKHTLTAGSWGTGATTPASGTMMFYNTSGTLTAAAIKNHSQSDVTVATIGTFGVGNAVSTAAGLYVALGGRGSQAAGQPITGQSWQWCDLGWTMQYDNAVVDFDDMNVGLEVANAAQNKSNVVTTGWKVGTTGALIGGSPEYWTASGGAWPGVVSAPGDAQYVFTDVSTNGGIVYGGKSGIFNLTGFGFTDADIPPTATLVGIQVQMLSGAIGISGSFTASYVDVSLNLIGLASGEKRDFGNGTGSPYPVTPSAGATTPMPAQYTNFNFATTTYGSQDSNGNPNTMLGYTTITPTDVKNGGFGIAYQVGPSPANAVFPQQIQFGIDYIAMRIAYLPTTNMVYFWDSNAQATYAVSTLNAGSNALTVVSGAFTSADVGKTVIIGGAGAQVTFNDGAFDGLTVAVSSASTILSNPSYAGTTISIQGQSASIAHTAGDGAMNSNSTKLTSATLTFDNSYVGMSVSVAGAGPGGATLNTLVTKLNDAHSLILRDANQSGGNISGKVIVFRTALITTTTSSSSPHSIGLASVGAGLVMGGLAVTIYGSMSATIKTVVNANSVTLSATAARTVSGSFVNVYQPIQAQIVQHYLQDGLLSQGTGKGVIYFHFIQTDGTVGGVPLRRIGANEQIRSYPTGGQAPDGGVADLSQLMAMGQSAAAENIMDWSALLLGSIQPDGSTAPPSKYQSITQNFYGSSGLEAIYGVSGGGPAFYYDGYKNFIGGKVVPGNFARILTGLPIQFEQPRSVVAHQGHLALGYYSGMVQWGNATNVLSFDPSLFDKTADNDGVGQPVTALASINGDSLVVGARQAVFMLQGNFNSPSTVYQSTIAPTSGMLEYSLQPMANYTYIDFRGITMIGATQKYGDFEIGHISSQISPLIIPRVQSSAFFEGPNIGYINSYLSRNKNQYRSVYADGRQITATFLADGELPQFTVQYLLKSDGITPFTLDVVQAFTERRGRDRMFAACNDTTGFVYELDRGTSFNGGAIPAYAVLVPDCGETPFLNKTFDGINVYGLATDYATFNVARAADYADPVAASGLNVITGTFGNAQAGVTGKLKPFTAKLTGPLNIEGTAIEIRFDVSSAVLPQFVLQAMAYNSTPSQEVTQ